MIAKQLRLSDLVKKHHSAPALITCTQILSYGDFYQQIWRMTEVLRECGVERGERVALYGPSSVEYVTLLMALLQVGAVAVPISTRFPERQITSLLHKIRCRRVIESSVRGHYLSWQAFRRIGLQEIFQEKLNSISLPKHPPPLFLDQDATIIFTSGSTGEPKAALHSFGNHYYSALGSNLNLPFNPGDRWLLSLPLYHVGGLSILFRAILGGGAVVLPEEGMNFGHAIQQFQITHLSLVSTQLFRLLEEDGVEEVAPGLKGILLGGGPIPSSLIQKAVEVGLPIFTTYGSTEMTSQVTTTRPADSPERLLTSGKPLRYREIQVGEDSQIMVRGATLFKGYVEGNRLNLPLEKDGWFLTGDLGRLDAEGYLTVTGRKDNMFISGGENIQPEEIEKLLCEVNSVSQAVVVPVEHKEFGTRPVAFLKMRSAAPLKTTELKDHLLHYLPRFKIPDHFFPWPETKPSLAAKPDRNYFKQLARKKILTMQADVPGKGETE